MTPTTLADGWATRIEHMLTRPRMFCANNHAYLGAMRTAFEAWAYMKTAEHGIDHRLVSNAWQAVVQDGYARERLTYNGPTSDFESLLRVGSASELTLEVAASYMIRVWRRMHDPVSMMGDLVRE